MQDLKVALVQADQRWEDKKGNLENYSLLLANLDKAIDLVILPEMFHTGFSMNVKELAEKMEESEGIQWLKAIANEKNAAFYTSLIIEENGHYYNRGVFVEPSGKLSIYDKRKRFGLAGEDIVFEAGTTQTIVNFRDWNINLQICYDLRFPEISRNKINSNNEPDFDICLYVANWPTKRIEQWNILLAARAIENQCYTIGVNRVGKDGKDLIYSGASQICDMLGNNTASQPFIEEIIIKSLSKEELTKTRKELPFLKD